MNIKILNDAQNDICYGNFAPLLAQLDALHQARSAKDVEYQWWVDDVRKFWQNGEEIPSR